MFGIYSVCGVSLETTVFDQIQVTNQILRKKCPYSELFWSVFSRIPTEYGEIRSIFPYSVRMGENADQNNSEYGQFSGSVSNYHLGKSLLIRSFSGLIFPKLGMNTEIYRLNFRIQSECRKIRTNINKGDYTDQIKHYVTLQFMLQLFLMLLYQSS